MLAPAACAPAPLVQPAATADSVLRAQYAARGPRGAMTGDEAGKIMHGYAAGIGRALAQKSSSTTDVGAAAMGGRAYDH
jgi:hypothetical protein